MRSLAPEQLLLTWENQIKLLLNREFWRSFLFAIGIASCLLTALMLFVSRSFQALLFGCGIFLFLLCITVLVAVVIDLFGGFQVRYALTTLGVRSTMGKGAKRAADAAFWTGIISGSFGAVGSGLLAKAEQNLFIEFSDLTTMSFCPKRKFIRVKGSPLQKPIGLYCLPDNYLMAEKILRQHWPSAKVI